MSDEQPSRRLVWDACYNAREVGGYPTANGGKTRWRALVRADNLHRLTAQGQAALRDYGVCTIIDLRLAYELEGHPSPFAANNRPGDLPRYLHLPIHDLETDTVIDAAESRNDAYSIILERNKELVGEIIKAVAEGMKAGGVLVHCHGGKDRTGIIVALLLSLVDVPRETIIEDYALSEAMLEGPNAAWLEEQSRARGKPVERPYWMFAPPPMMRALLDYLDREYGGVEGYLTAAGVQQSDIANIREHLLAPAD